MYIERVFLVGWFFCTTNFIVEVVHFNFRVCGDLFSFITEASLFIYFFCIGLIFEQQNFQHASNWSEMLYILFSFYI